MKKSKGLLGIVLSISIVLQICQLGLSDLYALTTDAPDIQVDYTKVATISQVDVNDNVNVLPSANGGLLPYMNEVNLEWIYPEPGIIHVSNGVAYTPHGYCLQDPVQAQAGAMGMASFDVDLGGILDSVAKGDILFQACARVYNNGAPPPSYTNPFVKNNHHGKDSVTVRVILLDYYGNEIGREETTTTIDFYSNRIVYASDSKDPQNLPINTRTIRYEIETTDSAGKWNANYSMFYPMLFMSDNQGPEAKQVEVNCNEASIYTESLTNKTIAVIDKEDSAQVSVRFNEPIEVTSHELILDYYGINPLDPSSIYEREMWEKLAYSDSLLDGGRLMPINSLSYISEYVSRYEQVITDEYQIKFDRLYNVYSWSGYILDLSGNPYKGTNVGDATDVSLAGLPVYFNNHIVNEIYIDDFNPTIEGIEIVDPKPYYGEEERVFIRVTFSEIVNLSNSYLTLNNNAVAYYHTSDQYRQLSYGGTKDKFYKSAIYVYTVRDNVDEEYLWMYASEYGGSPEDYDIDVIRVEEGLEPGQINNQNIKVLRVDSFNADLAVDMSGKSLDTTLPVQDDQVAVDTLAPIIMVVNAASEVYTEQLMYKSQHQVYLRAIDEVTTPNTVSYYWDKGSSVGNQSKFSPTDVLPNVELTGALTPVPSPTGQETGDDYYLHLYATDMAENVVMTCEGPFYFDFTEPEITITPSLENAQFSIGVTDSDSGVSSKHYTWYRIVDGVEEVYSSKKALESDTLDFPTDDGYYRVLIEALDLSGNKGEASSEILIDNAAPLVSFTAMEDALLVSDTSVEVSITDNSSLDSAYYQWVGINKDPDDSSWKTMDISSPVREDVYEVLSGPLEDGKYNLHVKAEDNHGNSDTYIFTKVFNFDNEAPNPVFPIKGSSVPSKAVELYLRVDNEAYGYDVYYEITTEPTSSYNDPLELYPKNSDEVKFLIDEQTVTNGTNTYYIHVKVVDQLGNFTTLSSEAILIDLTGPTGSISSQNPYTNQATIQVLFDASDIGPGSDFDIMMKLSEDGGATWTDWLPYTQSRNVTLKIEGTYEMMVQYRDVAGNVSDTYQCQIVYDTTRPVILSTDYKTEWTNDRVPVTVNFTDLTPSDQMIIEVIREETSADVEVTGNVISFKNNGQCTFIYKDLAGNVNHAMDKGLITISHIDSLAPKATVTPNGMLTKEKSILVDVSAIDNVTEASDIELYYTWSTSNLVEPNDWKVLVDNQAELDHGDGLWYLWIKAVDALGNTKIITSKSYSLDNTLPELIQVTYSPDKVTASDVVAKMYFDQAVTLISPIKVDYYGQVHEYIFTENGHKTITFADEAGNVNTYPLAVDWIVRSAPSAEVTYAPAGWTNSPVTITVTTSQALTGLYDFVPMVNGQRVMIRTEGNKAYVNEAAYHWNNDTGVIRLTGNDYQTTTSGAVTLADVAVDSNGVVIRAEFIMEDNGQIDYKIIRLDTGVTSNGEALVDKIDKIGPTSSRVYFTEYKSWQGDEEAPWTNKPIEVVIVPSDNSSQPVEVVNNGGSNQYIFTENGRFDFILRDQAGNETLVGVSATTIDRVKPTGQLTYKSGNSVWYQNDEEVWVKDDVTVMITTSDNSSQPVEILTDGGLATYTFTKNGQYTYMIQDAAGNIGEIIATVSKLDKIAPVATLSYSTQDWTKEDVEVLVTFTEESQPLDILNNGGSNKLVFEENGSFLLEYVDVAGNAGQTNIVISNIDKSAPSVTDVWLSKEEATNASVTVKVYTDEYVTYLTDGGSNTYTFEENGSHRFEFMDRAGNYNYKDVVVDNIDRQAPNVSLEYSITQKTNEAVWVKISGDEPIYVVNNYQRNDYLFIENGSFTFQYSDLAGNTGEITASVDYIDNVVPEISLTFSEEGPTREDVLVTINCDKDIIPVNYSDSQLTYTENGVDWYKVLDEYGKAFYFKVEVSNIDRTAPEIDFIGGDNLLVIKSTSFDPMADVIITDNIDLDIREDLLVDHNIDADTEGEYTLTYSATDTAGNTVTKVRKAIVIDPSQLAVYVNSNIKSDKDMIMEANSISLLEFGYLGDTRIKWMVGRYDKGDFKDCETYTQNGLLTVDRSGYWTLLVQDQERNTEIVHVYILYSK